MTKAQNTETKGSPEQYDDSIFYEQLDHYTGLALGFCHDLIENTPRNSNLAHAICRKIEDGGIAHPDLTRNFPKRRRNHTARVKHAKKMREPLEKERRSFLQQIKVLEKTAMDNISAEGDIEPGASVEIELSPDVKARVEELRRQVTDLDVQLSDIKLPRAYNPHYRDDGKQDKTKAVTAEDWAYLKDWFARKRDEYLRHEPNPLYKNLIELCDYLKIEEKQKQMLLLLLCFEKIAAFDTFINAFAMRRQKGYNAIVARMLGVDSAKVSAMFRDDNPLVANGLIIPDMDGDDALPELSVSLLETLSEQDISFEEIIKRMVGEPVTTDLDWDRDFAHLGAAGEELIKLLQGARDTNETGVNLLLYGLQDAGKTEAVKAACKKAGITLYAVGEKMMISARRMRNHCERIV